MDPDVYARILDVKGIGKLPTFDGTQSGFNDWRFRFEVSMSLLQLKDGMAAAAVSRTSLEFSDLSAQQQYKTRVLYAILVQQIQGKALSIARLVDNENGYEVWRRLVLEYDPESKIRTSRMLVGILRPTFGENSETFTKNLLDWEFSVKTVRSTQRQRDARRDQDRCHPGFGTQVSRSLSRVPR